jgi:hypothetical protein
MSTALPTTPWRIFSRFNRSGQAASFSAQRETVESAGLRTLGAFRHGFVLDLLTLPTEGFSSCCGMKRLLNTRMDCIGVLRIMPHENAATNLETAGSKLNL